MLVNSFIHAPGVGPKTELALWEAGLTCWDECSPDLLDFVGPTRRARIVEHLRESAVALGKHRASFFQECMPSREIWRLYPEFEEKTVFLDIETTGLSSSWDDITVISLFDGREPRALVKGRDLAEFPSLIKKYSLIVTYNGATFDLPFLHAKFRAFKKNYAHIDLRYPLARLGYAGGLKTIEKRAGIRREGALAGVDGFMAVMLWYEYKRGNRKALNTLLRYALEDVVNLKPLMEFTYNRNIRAIPLKVPKLKHASLPAIDVPFDAKLIRRFGG